MARFVYGFELYRPQQQARNYVYPSIGSNSEVFKEGDPIQNTASGGRHTGTGSSSTILGILARDITMTSTNQTSARVRPPLIPTNSEYEWLISSNARMSTLADIGLSFLLTASGTTGGITMLDKTTGAVIGEQAVVQVVDIDPDREGSQTDDLGERLCVVRIVKTNLSSRTGA